VRDRGARLPAARGQTLLPHGLGRSYGDVALNEGGQLLRTRTLDRFISFDDSSGVLRAEAGVSIDEVIDVALPKGWFLPVTPGTRFVTLGGAVANDVHGKNHHRAGSFGHHVRALELLRSTARAACAVTPKIRTGSKRRSAAWVSRASSRGSRSSWRAFPGPC
jgi:FAD/FMN-containing dehydrogenase